MIENNQLSIGEKWASDIRAYEDGAKVKTTTPQCERCVNFLKGNVLHCKKYAEQRKPKDVMFASKECPVFESADPLNVDVSTDLRSKLFGGIFGFCVADALGVPVEFSSRQARDADPVAEMRAYGTYHQPFGAWSDDTSLMLCLVDAMAKGFSQELLGENMVKFYHKGEFTPCGEVFDIGNSTASAIRKLAEGVSMTKCGGESPLDNGNGSLMRILPLAFIADKLVSDELVRLVEDVSSLTHAHPRSKLACVFYTCFASSLICGATKEEALDAAVQFVQQSCKQEYASEFKTYEMVLSKKIVSMNRDDISSTGYVVDTLEAVLWSFFCADSYREAVLTAINLGGDTDTIAALVGGLAGIYYGFANVPNSWVQTILKKHEIAELAEQFFGLVKK